MRRSKLLHIFEMVLVCALGLALVIYPKKTWETSLRILGIALLACGVLAALYYFIVLRRRGSGSQNEMLVGVLGCVAVVVGIVVLAAPKLFTNLFGFVAGILVAFSGILNLMKAIDVKKNDGKGWKVLLGLSLVAIALGVLIFIDPFKAPATLIILVGAVLIYNGVLGIVATIQE